MPIYYCNRCCHDFGPELKKKKNKKIKNKNVANRSKNTCKTCPTISPTFAPQEEQTRPVCIMFASGRATNRGWNVKLFFSLPLPSSVPLWKFHEESSFNKNRWKKLETTESSRARSVAACGWKFWNRICKEVRPTGGRRLPPSPPPYSRIYSYPTCPVPIHVPHETFTDLYSHADDKGW